MGQFDDKLKENPHPLLYKSHCILHSILPLILVALFVLLVSKIIYNIDHFILSIGEIIIIGYFVSEILVDFILYENKKVFLYDYWINILLIIPFLAAFRIAGRSAQALNATRSLEIMVGSTETTAITSRLAPMSRLASRIPYLQKSLHLIVDLKKAFPKVMKYKLTSIFFAPILIRIYKNNQDDKSKSKQKED